MNSKKLILISAILIVSAIFLVPELSAQCPMCKIAAESNLENGGSMGKGLNRGILYMLAMPYALVMTIGIIWYRNRNNKFTEE